MLLFSNLFKLLKMATQLQWVGSTKSPHSAAIPAEMWNQHKAFILEKYQHMTLKALKQLMETQCGFYAT